MEDSLYKKILFSGSINPGMSGGPALNKAGEVIGINVSTAGNEVSFLVPVEHLAQLRARVPAAPDPLGMSGTRWKKRIGEQLTENQDQYVKRLLDPAWNALEVGEAKVPGNCSTSLSVGANLKTRKRTSTITPISTAQRATLFSFLRGFPRGTSFTNISGLPVKDLT